MIGAGLRAPLPRGLIGSDGDRDGVVEAVVRSLTGRDEELLATTFGAPIAATVTSLLTQCVLSLDGRPPSADAVRDLSVGDREALLLQLRRATLGERIDCVATCPDQACRERLDLTLAVSDLLVAPVPHPVAWHDESFPSTATGGDVRVRFRIPTGGDQEATAELAAVDAVAAARALLARCVAAGDGSTPALPDDVTDAVAARMAELDPQAEIRLEFECAACGRPVNVLFDAGSFFFAEIAATSDRLADEIHAMAWYYHWSEADILDLPRGKRRRYLDLIAGSLAAGRARSVA